MAGPRNGGALSDIFVPGPTLPVTAFIGTYGYSLMENSVAVPFEFLHVTLCGAIVEPLRAHRFGEDGCLRPTPPIRTECGNIRPRLSNNLQRVPCPVSTSRSFSVRRDRLRSCSAKLEPASDCGIYLASLLSKYTCCRVSAPK